MNFGSHGSLRFSAILEIFKIWFHFVTHGKKICSDKVQFDHIPLVVVIKDAQDIQEEEEFQNLTVSCKESFVGDPTQ